VKFTPLVTSNDQTVAVLQGEGLMYVFCGICIGNGTIHEVDPKQVEPIARHQMIFSGFPWCRGKDALADRQ
jgi:hypothetical protein